MAVDIDPNEHDVFVLRQRFKMVVNVYEFSLPGADGKTPGPPFLYVKQKPFKFKEDIQFFVDDALTVPVMRILARQRFDPSARYDVTVADGTHIGQIQKAFGQSLLRSTYILYDADGHQVATVTEQNLAVALFRRLVGFLPYVGDLSNWLPIPYHFDFIQAGKVIGSYKRQLFKINDTYTLDLSPDPEKTLDRRLVLAIAVGMDALQAR